jgi:hypothetical protein
MVFKLLCLAFSIGLSHQAETIASIKEIEEIETTVICLFQSVDSETSFQF